MSTEDVCRCETFDGGSLQAILPLPTPRAHRSVHVWKRATVMSCWFLTQQSYAGPPVDVHIELTTYSSAVSSIDEDCSRVIRAGPAPTTGGGPEGAENNHESRLLTNLPTSASCSSLARGLNYD